MSKQVMRDVLSVLERGEVLCEVTAANMLRAEIAKPVEPVGFLADAIRFKVRGDEDSEACRIYGIPHELNGRWVALVAADDNCHLKLTTPPDTEAMRNNLRNAANILQSFMNGGTSREAAQAYVNALNGFIDNQGGGE